MPPPLLQGRHRELGLLGDIPTVELGAGGQVLSYSYDPMDRAATVGPYANITYTVDDRISSISYANGVLSNYTYDSRDRPTRILVMYNGTAKMDLNYTYDGTGNVLSIDSENYTYDYLERIASSAGPWGSTSYAYDGAGNMVNYTLNGATSYYNIGPSNELLQAGSTVMAYDLDGNIIGKSAGATSWGYSYDFEDRLVNATSNGQLIQSNAYDGSGERLMATVNGSSVVYAYEGNNVLYEKNMTTGAVTDHFYVGRLQLAKLSSSTPYYHHFDALGSIRLVTNSGAINAFSTNYLPYGIAYNTTGMETFMYTDKPVDSATSLYYFGARFYDASLFRFVSRDTNPGSIDDPLSLNLYSYAMDNPQTYVDTGGHTCFRTFAIWDGQTFTPTLSVSRPTFTPTPTQRPDFWVWLYDTYIMTEHRLEFTMMIVQTIAALVCPTLLRFGKELAAATMGVLFVAPVSAGGDAANLLRALRNQDYMDVITNVASLVPDILDAFYNSLNFLQIIELIGEGGLYYAGDVISCGAFSVAATYAGVALLSVSWGLFLGNAYNEYNTAYP